MSIVSEQYFIFRVNLTNEVRMESNSRRASKVQDAEVKIMSTKFQRQEKPKKKKKKDEELNEMKAEAEKKRQQIEEVEFLALP